MVQRGSGQALLLLILWMVCFPAHAQSTSFSYQGRLTDGGSPASGTYDLQLALFDSSSGGTQIGSTLTRLSVAVSGGVFTVQLDFGVNAFSGASRFLEIGVRPGGGGAFTTLSPRQQITSTPYAIRTLSATAADGLSNVCVACVQDSQISSVGGSKVTGNIPVASVPSGSTNYIQNTGSQQPSANFNISGNGTLGGNLLTGGRIGVGPNSPLHRLGISGGPPWTADFWGGAIDLDNASAIGWRGNSSGLRFGIGHTNAGLAFFRTTSELGTTGTIPSYDFLINNSGNVGIGSPSLTPALTSKVEIFAQDGMSINGFQPFLTLNDTNTSKKSFVQGVNGDAVVLTNSRAALVLKDVSGNVGVGTSTPTSKLDTRSSSGTAIYGESAAPNIDMPGVYGRSTGNGGTGVLGAADVGSGRGVYGASGSPTGVGVFAQNPFGLALYVNGNAGQARDRGGLIKAMIHVLENGTVDRCYNGLNGVSLTGGTTNTGCGFSVTKLNQTIGPYTRVDFGFQVDDRFNALIAEHSGPVNNGSNIGANAGFTTTPSDVLVFAFYANEQQNLTNISFTLIIF